MVLVHSNGAVQPVQVLLQLVLPLDCVELDHTCTSRWLLDLVRRPASFRPGRHHDKRIVR